MASSSSPVATAISDILRLRKRLSKIRTSQIFSSELRGHLKAVALAWFQTYRVSLPNVSLSSVPEIDSSYKELLVASERAAATSKIRKVLKSLHMDLVQLQSAVVAMPASAPGAANVAPPTFAVIPDSQMRQVLSRRWRECVACLEANAPLAATVMMGGLLESLFLARVNRDPNKRAIFTCASAPKDAKGNALTLKEWTLSDYVAVAHELKWITQAVRDVSGVLREYRNYIHPQKELTSQLSLTLPDATMFWGVTKAISDQLL